MENENTFEYIWYTIYTAKGIRNPSYRNEGILKTTHVSAHLCKRNIGKIKETNETGCL